MMPRAHFLSEKAYEDHLRDWFAGQIISGLLANGATYDRRRNNYSAMSNDAYRAADTMLAERMKGQPHD